MKTVLYAEDYPDDVFFMTRAFKRVAPACHLVAVGNGVQAIAYLTGERPFEDRQANPRPALVLLDLSMPLVNGFEVLQWIRAEADLQALPVFVLTSSDNEDDRERASRLGASGYLVKPGQPDNLGDLLSGLRPYWE